MQPTGNVTAQTYRMLHCMSFAIVIIGSTGTDFWEAVDAALPGDIGTPE